MYLYAFLAIQYVDELPLCTDFYSRLHEFLPLDLR